ncbi:MAG TPA: magnesium/cobalt transporter CorA [Gammaproteobacteria bacterium]|nr:magnesium/cobalt transporter CorA [Gammaproteobacteria bacterium]
MINAFELESGRLRQLVVDSLEDMRAARPVWVDFDEATEEERAWAYEHYGFKLPHDHEKDEEVGDIEASARFYMEETGELHIRSEFFLLDDEGGENLRVAFVLKDDILFSVHSEDLPVFRLLRLRARSQPGYVEDGRDVLLELYAANVEYSADALEGIYQRLNAFSDKVLGSQIDDEIAASVLSDIAREEDVNGLIRRNLMDTRRATSALMRSKLLASEQIETARQILRDIDSLDGHTGFLFDKLNFLMDATVGFININQNKIIKIFSVASVAMLPPTLIASLYGMNFRYMPELDWKYGYPLSLLLMALSIVAPFWYFRRKGWLKK